MPKQRANERQKAEKRKGFAKTGDANEGNGLPINNNNTTVVAENVLPVISVDEENQQPTFSGTTVKYKTLVNRSEQKIKSNTAFSKRYSGKTRNQTLKSGSRKNINIRKSTGNKLMDINLLQKCISSASVCKKCRSCDGILEIFERPCKRVGLAESLFLKCSKCKSITNFQTSKKVLTDTSKNIHRKVYDVNARSVFASTMIGCKGLAKMCGLLDLPRPVGSKPYNKILKTLSQKAVGKCEIIMRNAAKKLTK